MSIGKIAEFKLGSDNWRLYIERLEQYFVSNKITNELYVPTLITVMGASTYELLVSLCTPDKPVSKTFAELSDILGNHLDPKPCVLAERFKFRQQVQTKEEKISQYVADLKKLSKTCEFGTWLEESLRDQLVCGLSNETIRQRLFTELHLNFSKAYQLACSMEAAEKDAALVETKSTMFSGFGNSSSVTADCQTMAGAWRGKNDSQTRSSKERQQGQRQRSFLVREAPTTEVKSSSSSNRSRRLRSGSASSACSVCGGDHAAVGCRYSRFVCRVCNRQGHLARVCSYLTHYNMVAAEPVSEIDSSSEEGSEEVIVQMNQISVESCKPILIMLKVNNHTLKMECDTGSAVSCISFDLYSQKFSDSRLSRCNLTLRYYTGEVVHPVGMLRPLVKYGDISKYLDLYVIRNGKTLLLGRQWIVELGVQLPRFNCNSVEVSDFNLSEFSSRYCEVFADGLGRFTGGTVGIHLRPEAVPVFMRARPLAFALREPVERALDQLTRDGILTPVDRSDWATPIVPVVKKDGNIRICADYKLTLNKNIVVDRYPLPRVEDLLVRLHGGKRFTKIDLSQAYCQFELDERSKQYTVINTHKGLFRYNRLVFGLSSSPGIFQKRLEALFADLPKVGVFLDDIIITGQNSAEHLDNLHKVFDRLQSSGLRVKKEKCNFFAESVSYLGHVISKTGVHTCPDKIKAIVKTPAPTNVSELRAFIGLIMYYSKFIKNVSTVMAPLYSLLKAGVAFEWSRECENAFAMVKKQLVSSDVLVHYSIDLPLILTTDASSVGIGAVISQLTAEGERPVAFSSRSLSSSERAYSQIDREALSIVFGVRKFHQYLYGRKFTLRTDHKPLTFIFGNKVGIPVMAASRLQRWAVLLSGYNYDIEFVSSSKNCADALSRLPSHSSNIREPKNEVTYVNFVEDFLPITHDDIKKKSSKDLLLSKVMSCIQSGWPASCSDERMRPYYLRRHELYCERGCIMWGYRLVVPDSLQKGILKQLHVGHLGIVKAKSLARSYVWWPNIDAQIEATCKQCETCAMEADAPPRTTSQPWPYHLQPWSRLHLDFLGPINGKTFLVLIDSTSKWLEIFEMSSTKATSVIKVLRQTFARFGLPLEVTSDQGPPFSSTEFKNFLMNNGIRQSFSPAYHPSSNGAAENAVKLCKRTIRKAQRDNVDLDAALQAFLLAYRNSIHCTTGESPAAILQRRALRSRFDLLRSERARADRVRDEQSRQVALAGGISRVLTPGDSIWAREYGSRDKWSKGTVTASEGSRRYLVDTGNDRVLSRHVDQIRRRSHMSDVPCPVSSANDNQEASLQEAISATSDNTGQGVSAEETSSSEPSLKIVGEEVDDGMTTAVASSPEYTTPPSVMRPRRIRKPVIRFSP
ncbi:uncharacterized protein K02A2.6-like [Pararge aegeria]|uniref:uncharacterized protein K02A2.6-like n=1 Tax=Pararge aegeria TaxID=116150 RepID=UPI0019D115F3|nr:uncharacterized protein K02A2.6-like [Pararge aegeria]